MSQRNESAGPSPSTDSEAKAGMKPHLVIGHVGLSPLQSALREADATAQEAEEVISSLCAAAKALLGPNPHDLVAVAKIIDVIEDAAFRAMNSINSSAEEHLCNYKGPRSECEDRIRQRCKAAAENSAEVSHG